MNLNFNQIAELYSAHNELQEMKMPFKLGLIIAKNLVVLKTEYEFYIEREREFAFKYLEVDEETNNFKQIQEGVFKIKDGLEKECQDAREELNKFEVEINLREIPANLLENMELSPKIIVALENLIKEEE